MLLWLASALRISPATVPMASGKGPRAKPDDKEHCFRVLNKWFYVLNNIWMCFRILLCIFLLCLSDNGLLIWFTWVLLCRWRPTQSRHNWTNEWINKASVSYCPYWRLIVRFLLFLPFFILSLSVELTSWVPSLSLLQCPSKHSLGKETPFLLSNRKQRLISSYAVHFWRTLLIDFASSFLDIEYPTSSFYSRLILSPLRYRDHDGLI